MTEIMCYILEVGEESTSGLALDVLANKSESYREEVVRVRDMIYNEGRDRGIYLGKQEGISIGEQRGISIGEQRGRSESKAEIASRMRENNMPDGLIAQITGLTLDQIRDLRRSSRSG